ncbi:MAG: ATP-binding cassette domain-containing protein [bacterium]
MSIVLERLVKTYERHLVVNDVSLEVADGELLVLLGPSGSGKSTVLRLIAGLVSPDGGRVRLHDRDVTDLPPQRRGVGFVFQQYALFQHMTVAENVEFALKIRKSKESERRRRRDELLELVGLVGLGRRYPQQLSGGQQQRVALARALAHRPEVLLLDEPFGALDARIRTELRGTLRAVQRELRVTTLFVTHDQEEAFELGDRIAVMNFGRLLEVGPPRELYLRPRTEFVATFLGHANLMVGEATSEGVKLGSVLFPLTTQSTMPAPSRRVQVLFRPEDVSVKESRDALLRPLLGEATVEEREFSGSYERLRLRLPKLPGVRAIAPSVPYGADYMRIEAVRSQHLAQRFPLAPGDRTWVGVRRVHALTHPGLNLLLVTDASEGAKPAVAVGRELARACHARLTVLGCGKDADAVAAHLQDARQSIGSGLAALEVRSASEPERRAIRHEAARAPYDLVIRGVGANGGVEAVQETLEAGDHHVLLVRAAQPLPRKALLCVAVGEPGKADVLFAGRLVRHLGASVTLLTVLRNGDAFAREQSERFLAAGARTLSLLGVPTTSSIRTGNARETILAEAREGAYDLLVLGAPLPRQDGRLVLDGLAADLIETLSDLPILVVHTKGEPGS